jgi:sec-independent protein translocase protein TatC
MTEEKQMGILEHLEEFRSRLIIAIIAILATTAIAYIFADPIIAILKEPAGGQLGNLAGGQPGNLIAFGPMDGFMIKFRVSLYGGIFLAAPVWIYEVVRYLEPALLPSEKRFIIPAVIAMVILFLVGNVFGWLMLKNMIGVLVAMFGSQITYYPGADQYISFVVYFLVAVGIAFELPVVMLVLIKIGLLKPEFLRKQRRVAYFVLFVFAELITPVSDPIVAPMVVMVPMVLLFELALFLSRFVVPRPANATTPAKTEG